MPYIDSYCISGLVSRLREVGVFNDRVSGSRTQIISELLRELWRRRSHIWNRTVDACSLVPVPTDVIVRSVLELALEEPEHIPAERVDFDIAGFMDRSSRRIVIAQKFKPEWRRFTTAHESSYVCAVFLLEREKLFIYHRYSS